MTIDAFQNPVYKGQPKDKTVMWGYGLFPDKEGDYVHKKMSECTGEEILTEMFSHMHFEKEMHTLIQNSTCRIAMMPYITSQFMPREKGDRPQVIPPGSTNLAFVGQYCEMPDDTVFTVEYSVRSAMEAVYKMMGLEKTPPPVYKGQHSLKVLYEALKTTLK
jgi:oleate hydratase